MTRRRAVPGAPERALLVDKAPGPTSHDIVALARRALGRAAHRPHRHARPDGLGVLPLLLGRATRLAQFLAADDKTTWRRRASARPRPPTTRRASPPDRPSSGGPTGPRSRPRWPRSGARSCRPPRRSRPSGSAAGGPTTRRGPAPAGDAAASRGRRERLARAGLDGTGPSPRGGMLRPASTCGRWRTTWAPPSAPGPTWPPCAARAAARSPSTGP